jgi:hypothetical protein
LMAAVGDAALPEAGFERGKPGCNTAVRGHSTSKSRTASDIPGQTMWDTRSRRERICQGTGQTVA